MSSADGAIPVDDATLTRLRKPSVWSRRDVAVAVERTRWAPVVVGAAIAGWFAAVLGLGLVRHGAYLTGRYDHGNMVQAIWNTAHGHFLELTFQNGDQMSRLAAHADIFLALLAPLWLVAPSPVTLIVLQIAAVAIGALPVFWLARKHIGSETGAVAMVFAYLLYPWVAWGALEDFHSVTVAIGLLLFAIWALDADRLGLFAVFAGLALTTHELVGLQIMGLGVWYAFARRHRVRGTVIAVAGLAWSAIFVGLVIPAFAGGTNVFYGRFESVGGSPSGILRQLVTDPTQLLGAVATGNDYIYLFLLLVPLGAMWIYSPWMAFVATPQIGVNLLSDWEASTSPKVHYTSAIIPFLIVATVFGAGRFSPGKARGAVMVAVVAALFALVAWPRPNQFLGALHATPRDALREAASLVPADARVSATEGLGARLSDRRVIYSFPMIGDADWIVVDRRDSWLPDLPSVKRGDMPVEFARAVERFEADPHFRVVFDRDDVAVFRRKV